MSTETHNEEMSTIVTPDTFNPEQSERMRAAMKIIVKYLLDEFYRSCPDESGATDEQTEPKLDSKLARFISRQFDSLS